MSSQEIEYGKCMDCGDSLDRREYLTENLCDSCNYMRGD